MKVEIEIKKKDLRSILCAAIRNYYCEVKSRLEPLCGYLWQLDRGDRYIIENLCDIRDACDAIACMCNMIKEMDTVDNDVNGVIILDPDKEEQK
jgi:hypothetical protein